MTQVRPFEGFRRGHAEVHAQAGAETFVLRDGQTCLLRRKGHREVLSKVPVRAEVLSMALRRADPLDFPEMV